MVGVPFDLGHYLDVMFRILTNDSESKATTLLMFGEVESGLEVVKAASRHSNRREVKIADCGIVVPYDQCEEMR